MDIEKLIEQLKNLEACAYGYHINGEVLGMDCSDFEQIMVDAADEISKVSTLQAENEQLRAELERVKVERDAYQAYFKDLSSKPDCNTCEKRSCEYKPRPGAIVRVNCPLYSGPEKED